MRDVPRIGVNVERTVRHARHFKTERTQRRYDELPPAPEFQTSRFVNRKRSRLKTRQCRMLRERRRADEEVLREFLHCGDHRWRHDEPAEPPAGHVEALRA